MKIYEIKNDFLTVSVNSMGAELHSIKNKNGVEYLWNADKQYWARRSPILFPNVGTLKNNQYTYEGKTYTLPSHGFARDNDFTLVEQNETSILFEFSSNEQTYKNYPFNFKLQIGYTLNKNQIKVIWKVYNTDTKEMYFSIGAHPGFMCPLNGNGKQSDYSLKYSGLNKVEYYTINSNGLKVNKKYTLNLTNQMVKLHEGIFDNGVFIVENNQTNSISLVDSNNKPYVTVDFDAKIFGVWSPEHKNAPFVCLEPWYGRCDDAEFAGDLTEREFGNCLAPNKIFDKSYTITIN